IFILLLLILSIDGFSQTQTPFIQWEKSYGGTGYELLYSILSTSDGGYLLGGVTYSNNGDIQSGNHGSTDFWVVKINSTGAIEWEKTYGGTKYDVINVILSTSDGGYLLGGITYSNNGDIQSGNHGSSDSWVVKINSTGTIEWEKTYGGTDIDGISSILSTSDGGYFLGGFTNSNNGDIQSGNHGNQDFWVVKIGFETTGILEHFSENVKVYPIPINDNSFTIEIPFNHTIQLNFKDINGRTILTKDLLQNTNKITLEYLADGLYFIQLLDENKIIHQQKIIKRD
nr:T9SS type A sorting domain-containing protein [Bacteroidales bacterium]